MNYKPLNVQGLVLCAWEPSLSRARNVRPSYGASVAAKAPAKTWDFTKVLLNVPYALCSRAHLFLYSSRVNYFTAL